MPSSGPGTLWPFYESEEYGVSPALASWLRRQDSIQSHSATLTPIPPLLVLSKPPVFQLKEIEMNEFMQALEAMIRRIAQEEVKSAPVVVDDRDFRTGFKSYTDNNKAEWAAIVSQGCLDFPWFDDAIASEVATNTPVEPAFSFARKDVFDTYVKEIVENDQTFLRRVTNAVGALPVPTGVVVQSLPAEFERFLNSVPLRTMIMDTVVDSDTVHDHIMEIVEEARSERIDSKVQDYIDNTFDFNDIVRDAVSNLSFSVSVD